MRKVYTSGADRTTKAKAPLQVNVTTHISLPGPMRGFKDVDPSDVNLKSAFSSVETEHECKVEVGESGASIIVKAANRETAKEAIVALRELLLYQPGEESVWRTRILIHPARNGKGHFRAMLQQREGGVGVRPVAIATQDVEIANPEDVAAAKAEYKQELGRALDSTVAVLRRDPNAMRMRVHFGSITLDEWKKGKVEYTFADLGSFLCRAGIRGTARMINIVDRSTVEALKARLSRADGDLPESVKTYLDPSTKPIYSLLLQTKNLHVETSLDLVQAQGKLREKTRQLQQYTLGPLSAHQQEKRQRAVEILTLCPESHHDWTLEIRKAANRLADGASAPFTIQELRGNLSFPGDALGGNFPNISIAPAFIRAHGIKTIHGKATWTYALSLRYNLEITLFHKWGDSTGSPPVTVAGLTLYSKDWDDDMASGSSQPREWDENFATQFLKPYGGDEEGPGRRSEANDPLDHFLSWIHWIQMMLDDGLRSRAGN
ncbi:hypothetical protein MFIFM68171_01570 [Madurella fahalii]|uniref:DUF7905 domain-containing protein n=1 Tax=Madurella fahalii TaxID=1157608 RepID=A0ABQ0G0T5_9PEZI